MTDRDGMTPSFARPRKGGMGEVVAVPPVLYQRSSPLSGQIREEMRRIAVPFGKHFSPINLSKRRGENWGDFNERSNLRGTKKDFWVLKRSDMPRFFPDLFHSSMKRSGERAERVENEISNRKIRESLFCAHLKHLTSKLTLTKGDFAFSWKNQIFFPFRARDLPSLY